MASSSSNQPPEDPGRKERTRRERDSPDPSKNRVLILDTQSQGHRAQERYTRHNEEEDKQLRAVYEDAQVAPLPQSPGPDKKLVVSDTVRYFPTGRKISSCARDEVVLYEN